MLSRVFRLRRSCVPINGRTFDIEHVAPFAWMDRQTRGIHGGSTSIVPLVLLQERTSPRLHQVQQVRHMGRNDGHSALLKPRPPTKKQRKAFNRKKGERYREKVGKHSAPGSKAAHRRQFDDDRWQFMLDDAQGKIPPPPKWKYGHGDAILDDLMENSADLTSAHNPQPIYLGHHYNRHHRIVSGIMDHYHNHHTMDGDTNNDSLAPPLPTDSQIALLVRAYRDANSTKSRPLGISKALQHLLVHLRIPSTSFGLLTSTALMTCAASPLEARRIMKMMQDNQISFSSYTYSVLVDIHSRMGDFRGALSVITEMNREGFPPTLAAYTSLLAACYKVCKNSSIPTSIKAEAGRVAWENWQQMRIIGLEADVMAYGAIIRIFAARGLPERAINVIEEMQAFQVKPTTLIFTSALQAVAKSHANALRFAGGYSKKNKRRELITAHHAKLAQSIVILAESAEVEQDDGFTSSLMLCAATAGDSATVKAVYLASEVRNKMKRFQQHDWMAVEDEDIFSDSGNDPQALGAGEGGEMSLDTSTNKEQSQDRSSLKSVKADDGIASRSKLQKRRHIPTYEEREYGTDTRKLSALLSANAKAMEGLGMIWAGRDNKGYLCNNSIRRITIRPRPKYRDNSIPGLSSFEAGAARMSWDEEDVDKSSKKLRLKKFRGIQQDDSIGITMDDLEEPFQKMFQHNPGYDGQDVNPRPLKITGDNARDRNLLDRGTRDSTDKATGSVPTSRIIRSKSASFLDNSKNDDRSTLRDEKHFFDQNTNAWVTTHHGISTSLSSMSSDVPTTITTTTQTNESETDEEYYFDDNVMRWKTRPKITPDPAVEIIDKNHVLSSSNEKHTQIDMMALSSFQNESKERNSNNIPRMPSSSNFETLHRELLQGDKKESRENTEDDDDSSGNETTVDYDTSYKMDQIPASFSHQNDDDADDEPIISQVDDSQDKTWNVGRAKRNLAKNANDPYPVNQKSNDSHLKEGSFLSDEEDELQLLLQGLPPKRVEKLYETFSMSLGSPSILTLVPILREHMPDHMTHDWIKQMNLKNAQFVMEAAEKDGVIDVHVLNNMLQVTANSESLDRVLAFHDLEFKKRGLTPTSYSDRLVIQTLVSRKQVTRALSFKEKVEAEGRTLDIVSYGTLIEHYGNHKQLGSAIMTIQECKSIHGSVPGEHCLKHIRLLCRQQELEEKVDLMNLIGDDPLAYIREGEAKFKREYSKKGNRNVTLPRNRALQI